MYVTLRNRQEVLTRRYTAGALKDTVAEMAACLSKDKTEVEILDVQPVQGKYHRVVTGGPGGVASYTMRIYEEPSEFDGDAECPVLFGARTLPSPRCP